MWFQILTWVAAVLAIVGVILNVRLRIEGFYFWIATNIIWVVIDIQRGIYAQAALFAVYTVLSVWGIVCWRKRDVHKH